MKGKGFGDCTNQPKFTSHVKRCIQPFNFSHFKWFVTLLDRANYGLSSIHSYRLQSQRHFWIHYKSFWHDTLWSIQLRKNLCSVRWLKEFIRKKELLDFIKAIPLKWWLIVFMRFSGYLLIRFSESIMEWKLETDFTDITKTITFKQIFKGNQKLTKKTNTRLAFIYFNLSFLIIFWLQSK